MSLQASAVQAPDVPPARQSLPPVKPSSTPRPPVFNTASVSPALQAPSVRVAAQRTIVTQAITARKNLRKGRQLMEKWEIFVRSTTIARKAKEHPGSAMMVSSSPRLASLIVMLVIMAKFAGMAARHTIAQRTTTVMETRPTHTENCATMATMDLRGRLGTLALRIARLVCNHSSVRLVRSLEIALLAISVSKVPILTLHNQTLQLIRPILAPRATTVMKEVYSRPSVPLPRSLMRLQPNKSLSVPYVRWVSIVPSRRAHPGTARQDTIAALALSNQRRVLEALISRWREWDT